MHHLLSRPSDRDRLRPGTRDHSISEQTIRLVTRELIRPCPRLVASLDDAQEAVEAFYDTITSTTHDLGWTLPLELARYLDLDDSETVIEVMINAALRWVRMADRGMGWLLLASERAPGVLVLVERRRSLDGRTSVARAHSDQLRATTWFACATGLAPFTTPPAASVWTVLPGWVAPREEA